MGRVVLALLLLGACGAELGGSTADLTTDAAGGSPDSTGSRADAAVDGTSPLGPWGTPAIIPGANSAVVEDDGTLSSNTLELYFKREDAADPNLYVMTRASSTSAWSAPSALTLLNSTAAEESPRLSPDDLTLYFGRAGEIYRTTRASLTSPWTAPTVVTALNTAAYEKWAHVCSNGSVVVSRLVTGNGQDLFEGTITAGATTALTALNSTAGEQGTLLTPDCLRLYFQSNRDGQFNIYMTSRATTSSPWGAPTALPDFNTTTYSEEDPWISADERTFVFASNSSGNKNLYIATR